MKSTQQGFTLIELVMVIVILGILAATAIPRFVDLSAQATQSAVEGVAGSLGSASAINYAAGAAGNPAAQTTAGVGCAAGIGILLNDGLPPGYTVAYQPGGAIGDATALGETWGCTVTSNGVTVNWTLHYVP